MYEQHGHSPEPELCANYDRYKAATNKANSSIHNRRQQQQQQQQQQEWLHK
jgi:hypothetical protein